MHGNVGNLCFRECLPELLLHWLYCLARQFHELRIGRLHLLQERIADIHVHAQAADGWSKVIDQSEEQFLIVQELLSCLLLCALHDGARQAHEMKIIHDRSDLMIILAVKAPSSHQMHGDVANLILRHLDCKL